MPLMDITCGDCGARFRLDPALLKDSSAARIRCRKCGGRIVVRLPGELPVPAPCSRGKGCCAEGGTSVGAADPARGNQPAAGRGLRVRYPILTPAVFARRLK